MKISLNKNDLQIAIQKLSKAIPTRTTLPILNCVLFQVSKAETKLRGTDLEITIIVTLPASVEEEGSSAVPIQKLLSITNELPEGRITISTDEQNRITLFSDLGSYDLMGKPVDEFPAPPETKEKIPLAIDSKLLSKIIKTTSFVISADDLKPAITGLFIKIEEKRLTAVATDGHRLVRYTINDYKTDKFTGEVIIPRKFLHLLSVITTDKNNTKLWIGKNHVTATGENITAITRIIDERYPDYESVIPKENKKTLLVNKGGFFGAVKRVSIFSNKMTHQVSIRSEDKKVLIKTEDPETASRGHEEMECSFSGDPITVGFNANYLKDILSHVESEKLVIKMDTPISATLFEGESEDKNRDITMLLMPVRLND